MEPISILMVHDIKDIGKMTVSMVLEHKLGLMGANTREITNMDKKMEKESTYGKMEAVIVEVGEITK